jgi:hypothetical protein
MAEQCPAGDLRPAARSRRVLFGGINLLFPMRQFRCYSIVIPLFRKNVTPKAG